ncbi:hypothetical protein A6A27_25440 [Micromonospora sp. CB01531]|nr:hypothetical protein A6A27_25440 [Micromonospora sp. CB01531]
MAELFGDDFDVDSGTEGDRGRAVGQVVQADRGQPALAYQAAEPLGDRVGMPAVTVRTDEEQPGVWP